MTQEQRAREFVTPAFTELGVNSLEPYIKIVAELIDGAVIEERERCAKIADEFVERTNADIAHAIAAAIRRNKD